MTSLCVNFVDLRGVFGLGSLNWGFHGFVLPLGAFRVAFFVFYLFSKLLRGLTAFRHILSFFDFVICVLENDTVLLKETYCITVHVRQLRGGIPLTIAPYVLVTRVSTVRLIFEIFSFLPL